jgi:hypothetical protein
MTLPDLALWILRGFGALWIVGGVFLMRQLYMNTQLDGMIAQLEKMAGEDGKPSDELDDKGRERWLFAGGVLTIAAGAAMAFAHRLAVPLLAALIIQQLLYFIRQRRRELAAQTESGAEGERPSQQTINGFFTSLLIATLAAWLYSEGKLL